MSRTWCACEWGLFWFVVGLCAGASWTEALCFGLAPMLVLGWCLHIGVFRFFWDIVTLRQYQLWRHPDWPRTRLLAGLRRAGRRIWSVLARRRVH